MRHRDAITEFNELTEPVREAYYGAGFDWGVKVGLSIGCLLGACGVAIFFAVMRLVRP